MYMVMYVAQAIHCVVVLELIFIYLFFLIGFKCPASYMFSLNVDVFQSKRNG